MLEQGATSLVPNGGKAQRLRQAMLRRLLRQLESPTLQSSHELYWRSSEKEKGILNSAKRCLQSSTDTCHTCTMNGILPRLGLSISATPGRLAWITWCSGRN